MNIKLLYIGKNKNNNIETLIENYEDKIKHFINFKIQCLKTKNKSSQKSSIIKFDSEIIFKNLKKEDIIILLDEKGKDFNSMEFSKFLEERIIRGVKNLTFVIGGAYGFSKELREFAKNKISLSKMTFSHDMARLFFVEQLYRSLTIINNIPYHNK
ncbi:MAG: 23S rRNA (pseudouridine(1915)-N(3))-methyltransferase RlmH [Flavobacteriaceae bacterium]|nr:23S rRNA (pseudouridine(1915)-N(3))-methyltransferase RlmH [Flavobacteriaceae bacterium]